VEQNLITLSPFLIGNEIIDLKPETIKTSTNTFTSFSLS
jgi:hypothetical protein